ncbi:MAG: hypothetical protein GC168_02570 [Candidatus Hydrogenedens sp.]|nr:hypothetical protein [Candidatus Hydrogenedens sp.]
MGMGTNRKECAMSQGIQRGTTRGNWLGRAVVAVVVLAAAGAQSQSNTPRIDMPAVNGQVDVITRSGNTVYVGGSFTQIGTTARNNLAAFDVTTGSVSAWNPNPDGPIGAILVSGSTVYLGGNFSSVGGASRNYIAALSSATGNATSWAPTIQANSTFGPPMTRIYRSGSSVFVCGGIASISGQSRTRIGAIDATSGLVTAWDAGVGLSTFGILAFLNDIEVGSGTLYFCGNGIESVGGQTRTGAAAVNESTGAVTSWKPNPNDRIRSLAISGSSVYLGGSFTTVGGQTRNRLASVNTSTGSVSTWNPNANSTVNVVEVSGSSVYVGGSFTSIGSQSRQGAAAVDSSSGAVTSWNPMIGGTVYAISAATDAVILGGNFVFDGGIREGLAVFYFSPVAPSNPGGTATGPTSIVWNWSDNSLDETGFRCYGEAGSGPPTILQIIRPADSTSWTQTGLTPNTQYSFQVASTISGYNSERTANITRRTLAATPLSPTVNAPTLTTVNIAIKPGDNNPTGTQYALQHVGSGQWVQSSGALNVTPVFRQSSAWATTTVTGLPSGTANKFVARARNTGDLIETANSPESTGHTLSATPLAPVVSTPTAASLSVTIASGDGNGAATQYALRETNSGLYIQTNGTLGAAPVFRSMTAWGTATVIGLAPATGYAFSARARNGALIETADGSSAGGTTLVNSVPSAIAITPSTTGPTNADSVDFAVVFDEDVTGFDGAADVLIAHSGTAHGGVAVAGGPASYTVTVSGISGDGSFTMAVNTASDVQDLSANGLASSVTSAAVLIDNTSANVLTIGPATTGPTNADSVDFAVVFDEDVTGFDDAADVLITHSGTAHGGVAVAGGPAAYTVTVSGITGDGSFTLAVNTASDVQDLSANGLASSVTSAAVLIDNTPPTASIASAADSIVNLPIAVEVGLSEPAADFESGDWTLTNASVSDFAGSGQAYTLTLSALGQGGFSIGIPADVFTDTAGNGNLASAVLARTFDSIAPSFTGIVAEPSEARAGDTVLLTFGISEELPSPPVVTVNGRPADLGGKAGDTWVYQVTESDPEGPAEIAVSGFDHAGNAGTATSTSALTILPQVPSVPVGSAALAALLLAAAGARKR